MKEKYIELMEKALSAYPYSHIERYFADVKRDGLREHGFPRLTTNIGILISHGRRHDLLPIFLEMMDFCCSTIPYVKAANDFSVREIICCIREAEQGGVIDAQTIARWKENISKVDPYVTYSVIARTPDHKVKNWALFTGVSEFFRQDMGLCSSEEFIDVQLASQLQWMEENSMYMDDDGEVHHPIVYDLVPRGLFCLLLNQGYRGKYRDVIDAHLKKAGLLTLKMHSPTGEAAFGGRSNQFIHNEAWLAAIFEYEARRYAAEGNYELAGKFKAAVKRAVEQVDAWLSRSPIYHIKNRFPTETKYGCEEYAYFDKYMITAASFLYAAYLLCDDSIPTPEDIRDVEPCTFATSYHFHKLFAKAGGYGIEFDTNADPHYDASGLGRVHRAGAPTAICLSLPCPSHPAAYKVDIDAPTALSLCPAKRIDGVWELATYADTAKYEVISFGEDVDSAHAVLGSSFSDGSSVKAKYKVSADGVEIELCGDGDVSYALPALLFDGEKNTDVTLSGRELCISYEAWRCRYIASGAIEKTDVVAANRNGHYGAYIASAKNKLSIKIEIEKIKKDLKR